MIRSFADKRTQALYETGKSRFLGTEIRVARRKLDQINSAQSVNDLRVPPGNRLEQLSGVREGQYSIRVNDQYRICFSWDGENAFDVEIADYH